MSDPVLDAIVRACVDATDADWGWVAAVEGDRLRVVALAGPPGAGDRGTAAIGQEATMTGTTGMVASSGQPMALMVRDGDPHAGGGVAALLGIRPRAVLAVPCGDGDGAVGVVEVVDKHGGTSFSFDDVELVTLLAGIAAAALASSATRRAVPGPAALGAGLARLAAQDPPAYAAVAGLLDALLDHG